MTDSTDRSPEEETNEAIRERMKQYPVKSSAERTDPIEDLPSWAKTAIVKREVFGLSYKEASKEFSRTAATLSSYAQSPAGKKIRAKINEWKNDPVELAKAYIGSNALSVTLDRFLFLEWAKDARDYQTGDKIASDLQDRMGITKKSPKQDFGGMVIHVELPGGDMQPLRVESGHEQVEDEIEEAEYEIEE